jgi:very-short-patch-repair endonuclease
MFESLCAQCGSSFMVTIGDDFNQYCSDICSGKGSNDNRLQQLSRVLRAREAWRYVQLNTYLNEHNIPHQFEFPLGNYVFDLALTDEQLLIEFDEPYHEGLTQASKDLQKDSYAEQHKFSIVRIPVGVNTIISAELIEPIINICRGN